MESATAVRCPGCGYDNNPYYRYCGMCGSPLRAGDSALPAISASSPPPQVAEPAPSHSMDEPGLRAQEQLRRPAPISINGFSFLGLGNDEPAGRASDAESPQIGSRSPRPPEAVPEERKYEEQKYDNDRPGYSADLDLGSSRSVQYLLEDDEPQSHGRMYVALLLLALAAGTLIWHWQTNAYPWEELARERTPHAAVSAAHAADTALPSNSNPAAKPSPAPSETTTPTADANAKAEKNATELSSATPLPSKAPMPQAEEDDSAPPAASLPVEPQTAPGKEATVPAKKPAAREIEPAFSPEIGLTGVSPADPANLFTEGEKYLYGDGVPQNCDRAQKDLRTSAAQSYPQAESLLGTMYAGGHCLGRDLPAAYRWYARALRHEPANSRISSDLQVLWNQMTAAERKAAQTGQ